MNLEEDGINWHTLARRMQVVFRTLFIATISWDLLLTVGFHTSQRAIVLTGIGTAFAPYIIVVWAVCILGLFAILIHGLYGRPECKDKFKKLSYAFLFLILFLYIFLIILGLFNISLAWPVILNYMVNVGWIISLIYFSKEFHILDSENL